MASASRSHEHDEGTQILVNAGCSISDATLIQIKYQTPSGATGAWTGILSGTNYAYHITTADQLEDGLWTVQLYVETPDGKWHGDKVTFQVVGNIEVT